MGQRALLKQAFQGVALALTVYALTGVYRADPGQTLAMQPGKYVRLRQSGEKMHRHILSALRQARQPAGWLTMLKAGQCQPAALLIQPNVRHRPITATSLAARRPGQPHGSAIGLRSCQQLIQPLILNDAGQCPDIPGGFQQMKIHHPLTQPRQYRREPTPLPQHIPRPAWQADGRR